MTTENRPENERHVSEAEAREVAEASREKEWKEPSFLKEMFLGNLRMELVHPWPEVDTARPAFREFYDEMARFLREDVDSVEIDATGEYPDEVIDHLRKMGSFGMKIPTEYGGLGFTQVEYDKVMELLGGTDGNIGALLSAHQSIGVPQPLKVFGSEEQKKKYLPRCAKGAITAFALTEPHVGSDPAKLGTTAVRTDDGKHYIINGEKLWCTNGTLAELLVVMALHPDTKKISTFVIDTKTPGVKVEHRCRFMGLKAIGNAVISFTDVKVPVEDRIGEEGHGLKIALVTLNTGRLALPASATGSVKACVEVVRRWATERVQWGLPIGKHEAIGHKIADMTANVFAMESVSNLASSLAARGGYDIRLEAAAAKEWNTVTGWNMVDDTMQIRGGRGYETEQSLASRGETPIGVERMMRDSRINRIFEGSSEIMHLFMAREAVDKHLSVAGAMVDPKQGIGAKAAAFPKIALFYAWWYPTRWLGWGRWPRFGEFGRLAKHLRFVERNTRRLARQTFHGMMWHQAKLERKQVFLFRIVDIGNELFAMTATICRANHMRAKGHEAADSAAELADLFCRNARRKIKQLFHELWNNDDDFKYSVAKNVLAGKHTFVENGFLNETESMIEWKEKPTEALPEKATPKEAEAPAKEDEPAPEPAPTTAEKPSDAEAAKAEGEPEKKEEEPAGV